MSTETTNKKIKIDNGTTFGRTYTDKAVDAKLPTDLIASANKLSLGVGTTALGNGVNLDGFTYDEATKTLKATGGGGLTIKSFNPTLTFKRIENSDADLLMSVEFESNISTEIENYVESLISSNKIFNINALIKAESYDRYRYVVSGNSTFYDFAHFNFKILFSNINYPNTNEYVEIAINEGQIIIYIKILEQYYTQFKQLAPIIFTNNTVIKVSVISYD